MSNPERDAYNSDVTKTARDWGKSVEKTAKKVAPHEGENKTTTSTEGKVETTTTEK